MSSIVTPGPGEPVEGASRAAAGYQLWSERYDRDMKDVFDVQDEIAKAIAERLRLGLGGAPAR